MSIEVEVPQTTINNKTIEVEYSNSNTAIAEGTKDLEVTVNRREYNIVGDELYIPKRYEDAPQWLRDIIDTVTSAALSNALSDVSTLGDMLDGLIAELNVAKNTYTMSIISDNDINERINTAIETLNSSLADADSTILDIAMTRVTPEEAQAIAIGILSASINGGDIAAAVQNLQSAIAGVDNARALDYTRLNASIGDEFEASATAIRTITAYVGIDESGASTGTGLLADVEILQKQNDGVIETVTGTYDVITNPQDPNLAQLVTTAEPYATWKASDVSGINTRLSHIGDVFIKYIDNPNGSKEYVASYKFIRTVVDTTSPYSTDSDGFTWALIIDQAAQDAYNQALNAYDLADNKRRVFVSTPHVPYDIGDLWLVQAGVAIIGTTQGGRVIQVGDVLRCSEAKTATGLYENNDWIPADNYRESMEAIKSNLQGQIDGKVETYYSATVPTGMTAVNNGDYWYCMADISTYKKGKIYKYVHATTSWIETADVSRYAFDTADGKASIFTSTNAPTTGYKINDMLIVVGSFTNGTTTFSDGVVLSSTATRVSGFTSADWVKKINDTEDLDAFVSVTYTPTVTSLQNQIDGKIESWYTLSTNDPKTAWTDAPTRAKHDGDMWYQTDTKLSYYYSSSINSWNLIDDAKAIQALTKAATAQATADGKISSYYMSTLAAANVLSNAWTATEKTNNIGDLVVVWDDSTLDNNGTWRWNGTNWVTTRDKKLIALASDVTNLSTELTNGTNTWASADSTLENGLRTEITDEGARVESKFAYNSNLNINGVWKKSGFGLTTNYTSGSGTEANPYVSEFWIDASRLKFTNSNQTGRTSPFTIDASGTTPQVKFNGVVEFSNVSNVPSLGSNNMLVNAGPTLGNETYGWQIGWYNTNIAPTGPSAGFDSWRPTGGGSVYAVVGGSPTVGTVFDLRQSTNIPVVAGKRYEISALLSSHRCTSVCTLAFFNSSGTYITESGAGTANSVAYSGAVGNWVRQGGFVTAPAGTAYAQFYVRSTVTGTDPYCFVAQAYMAEASASSTQFSTWGEGLSANSVINWQSEVQAAINNNATTIDGGKIVTNTALVNNLNAVGGIVADSIRANEINGITINGGVINGARINGAVIKASYLDLDGELEVLTNYHISVATRNSNPSLYSDAVYISADNEYRIPSYSVIKESSISYYITSPTTKKGILYSYNTANTGTNNKAVKIMPYILATSSFQLIRSVCADTRANSTFNSFILSMGGVNLLTYSVTGSGNNINVSISGTYFTTKSFSFYAYTESSYSNSWTVDIGFANISLSYVFSAGTSTSSYGDTFYGVNNHTLTATVNTGERSLLFNWNNANPITFQQIATPYSRSVSNGIYTQSVSGSTTFSLNQSLQINNMI